MVIKDVKQELPLRMSLKTFLSKSPLSSLDNLYFIQQLSKSWIFSSMPQAQVQNSFIEDPNKTTTPHYVMNACINYEESLSKQGWYMFKPQIVVGVWSTNLYCSTCDIQRMSKCKEAHIHLLFQLWVLLKEINTIKFLPDLTYCRIIQPPQSLEFNTTSYIVACNGICSII